MPAVDMLGKIVHIANVEPFYSRRKTVSPCVRTRSRPLNL